MAAHESPRTTKLYDQRNDVVTFDEVEKVVFEGRKSQIWMLEKLFGEPTPDVRSVKCNHLRCRGLKEGSPVEDKNNGYP
jgi:hypothetical protein